MLSAHKQGGLNFLVGTSNDARNHKTIADALTGIGTYSGVHSACLTRTITVT